jgi:hypothetical protein
MVKHSLQGGHDATPQVSGRNLPKRRRRKEVKRKEKKMKRKK